MLGIFGTPELVPIAEEVEASIRGIVEAATGPASGPGDEW